MNIRKSLTTFAVAAVLAASVAPGVEAACQQRAAAPSTADRPVLEGQVAAVDHDSGRLILETDEGFVALQATPDEVDGINIGDVITVSLLDEDGRE